jgi:hypothetical protein
MPHDDNVLFNTTMRAKPARMSLGPGHFDRRDHVRRAALVSRIVAEFDDMPGMALSLRQAGRFLGVDDGACARILAGLVKDGKLRRNGQQQFVRNDVPQRRAHA